MKQKIYNNHLQNLTRKLKARYPSLTDSDLLISNDDEKSMLTMVAYKLRKSKQEMSSIIENL